MVLKRWVVGADASSLLDWRYVFAIFRSVVAHRSRKNKRDLFSKTIQYYINFVFTVSFFNFHFTSQYSNNFMEVWFMELFLNYLICPIQVKFPHYCITVWIFFIAWRQLIFWNFSYIAWIFILFKKILCNLYVCHT